MDAIDFVITWVDGNDSAWRKERERFSPAALRVDDDCRYRDWETLKYWFRGIEKFAPWVNRIHFVTCGHYPEWLDTTHPKLRLVRHEEFIPKEYLPTFNSNVIEFHLHKIKDLAEQFVYFNDDTFLLDQVSPERFFRKGLPCDTGGFQIYNRKGMFGTSIYLAIQLINDHFNKRDTVGRAFSKWFHPSIPYWSFRNLLSFTVKTREFCGFFDHHLAQGFLKKTFEEVWAGCGEDLRRTSANRFRSYGDVAFWLVRYWQLASDRFSRYNVNTDGVYFNVRESDIAEVAACIREQRKRIICLNDTDDTAGFERLKKEVLDAFEAILPEKSGFERQSGQATIDTTCR